LFVKCQLFTITALFRWGFHQFRTEFGDLRVHRVRMYGGARYSFVAKSRVKVDHPLACSWLTLSPMILALVAVFPACSQSPVKLQPVVGKVLFKDQPIEGAQVVFQPAGGASKEQPMAYGTANADGTFDLRTEYGVGAVAGDYHVMITWYAPDPRNTDARVSKLPARYADQSNPILKATVKEGKNELEPFRLR